MVKEDLNSFVGKVIFRRVQNVTGNNCNKMYFICGSDKIENKLLVIPFENLKKTEQRYKAINRQYSTDTIISLSEAYDICYSYIKPMLELHQLYKDVENFEEDKLSDLKKTLSRMNSTLYMLYYFRDFKCQCYYDEERNQKRDIEIEEEKRKWNKGLRKIKKRTFHYFSDETFDFLVDNYRQKMNIKNVDFVWLNDEIKPYVEILQGIEELLS